MKIKTPTLRGVAFSFAVAFSTAAQAQSCVGQMVIMDGNGCKSFSLDSGWQGPGWSGFTLLHDQET